MAWGDNSYNFMTRWRVQGTVEEVVSVLDDARELPRWWPSVYLDINIIQAGDENHVGEVFHLFTKGLLLTHYAGVCASPRLNDIGG